MNKLRLILVLLVATVNVQSTPSARADLTPTVFVRNVFDPVGVAVDPSGNIWASIQGTANAYLIKYSPAGQLLDRIALGNFFTSTGLSCHIAIDASTGLLWAIGQEGDVFVVDTTTDKGMAIGNLRQLTLDASKTVDVSTGTVHDFSGYLFTVTTTYGDVAIDHQDATHLMLYVTAISVGFPYLMRVAVNRTTLGAGAQVIASSLLPGDVSGLPRGVAVSSSGHRVYTTLPVPDRVASDTPTSGNFADRIFSFSLDYPDVSDSQTAVGFNGHDLFSYGMDSDTAGTIYIATPNTSLCYDHPTVTTGVLVIVPPDLSRKIACLPLNGPTIALPYDVSVTADGHSAYMSVNNLNLIAAYNLAGTPPVPPGSSTPTAVTVTPAPTAAPPTTTPGAWRDCSGTAVSACRHPTSVTTSKSLPLTVTLAAVIADPTEQGAMLPITVRTAPHALVTLMIQVMVRQGGVTRGGSRARYNDLGNRELEYSLAVERADEQGRLRRSVHVAHAYTASAHIILTVTAHLGGRTNQRRFAIAVF